MTPPSFCLITPALAPPPPEMTKRDVPGFAIGGLSGGESKGEFWRMVALSTSRLPKDKPRYLMGVGYVEERGDAAPHPPVGNGFLGTPAPGCRGAGKDTALSGRELSPLLGLRVPMLGGGPGGVIRA